VLCPHGGELEQIAQLDSIQLVSKFSEMVGESRFQLANIRPDCGNNAEN